MGKVLGVLGGMGPAATVAFLEQLQALTPAAGDADHIRVIADINPRVPNRNTEPEAAGRELAGMAAALRDAGAQVLAMPCNTAHAHAAAIKEASGLPLIHIIEETARAVHGRGARRPGVLGTGAGRMLHAQRLDAVLLAEADQAAFMDLIGRIKAGDTGAAVRAGMARLAARLVDQGADAVVAGCTEVPLVLGERDLAVPLIDTLQVLAAACVRACR
ncbi:MAG: aspartate racemase [Brevundimonas sp.]|jgi:aspartate racemase|uniref:aspartate/glutamate racemase family protein n=1 Tax=Brevundimonas sp. TaxID=1871086 RepID=UPI0039E4006B